MRRYRIHHSSRYSYDIPVTHSRNLCLLLPRPLDYQMVRKAALHIDPAPEPAREISDGLGNRLYDFTVNESHRHFEVLLEMEIEIQARHWNEGCHSLSEARHRLDDLKNPLHLEAMAYRYPSRHIVWNEEMEFLTGELRANNIPPHACAQVLMERIFSEWKFRSGVTGIHTTVEDLLRLREGVCQDFSHLMIAALRHLGIPARYVSGYLETLPKPGMPKLVGTDVSHAWVQAYDPVAGWKDFDPTNNLIPAEQHITLAFGRDFSDISPLRGLVTGGGKQELLVGVDVVALV